MIRAHGGKLVNRTATENEREELLKDAQSYPKLELTRRELSDLQLIGNGAMSPLEGFMVQEEYESVLERMRLPLGTPWPLPVTVSVKSDEIRNHKPPFMVALTYDERVMGLMSIDEIYEVDHAKEAQRALLTTDGDHPGVQYLESIPNVYAGGKIKLLNRIPNPPFENYDLEPRETRILFKAKGWERVVGFQTRNPIHRAHEYLLKCALEMMDGLLIHPIMGETKSDDIPADVRLECYLALMENHFAKDRVALSIFPAAMRYAGPREAIFHAILRQNYGCTHFIVGRDHAGVGNYYGTYDAQHIFSKYEPGELDITPIFFEHSFYCNKSEGMASQKTTNSAKEDRVFLSGTKVREMLQNGEKLPKEFTRREVAEILENFYAKQLS